MFVEFQFVTIKSYQYILILDLYATKEPTFNHEPLLMCHLPNDLNIIIIIITIIVFA